MYIEKPERFSNINMATVGHDDDGYNYSSVMDPSEYAELRKNKPNTVSQTQIFFNDKMGKAKP